MSVPKRMRLEELKCEANAGSLKEVFIGSGSHSECKWPIVKGHEPKMEKKKAVKIGY